MVAKERLRIIKALVVVWIDTFVAGDIHEAERILEIVKRMVASYRWEKLEEMQ